MLRTSSLLVRLLWVIAAALVVLLPAELFLRSRVRLHPPIARSDPVTLYSLRPDRTVRDTSPGDFSVVYTTNEHGFRYRSMSVDKPPGTLRILGVGDSYTFGVGVEADETYLAHLERQLRQHRDSVEVVNCGTSGWGTSHALAFVESRGFAMKPDLIVLGFYANDPQDDLRSGLFRVDNGTLQRTPADQLDSAMPERSWITRVPLYDFLAQRSALLALLRGHYVNWRDRDRQAAHPAGHERATPYELTRHLFKRLDATAAERGIPVVFLLIPRRWSVDDRREPLDQFAAIREICDDEQLFCLDTTYVLQAAELPEADLYYQVHDHHWRPVAHRLAGQALYDYLSDNGLLSVNASRGMGKPGL